jgi:hypothetical protein
VSGCRGQACHATGTRVRSAPRRARSLRSGGAGSSTHCRFLTGLSKPQLDDVVDAAKSSAKARRGSGRATFDGAACIKRSARSSRCMGPTICASYPSDEARPIAQDVRDVQDSVTRTPRWPIRLHTNVQQRVGAAICATALAARIAPARRRLRHDNLSVGERRPLRPRALHAKRCEGIISARTQRGCGNLQRRET